MAGRATPNGGSDFRAEIQALRAVAVVAVVAFHFWPGRLSGGYVGVDVFFVVSGYLITAHLLRDLRDHGRIDIPAFWARRIRRLLPASLLVLAVTTVGILLIAPRALWGQFLREVIASALYVENWVLALDSVDYLAAENTASPVQHYWSLSAEEQFYLLWPLVIAVAALAGRRGGWPRRYVFGALAALTGLSLVYSIVFTIADPAPAYFATPTRVWEFGAGGLLAFVSRRRLDERLPRHAAAALSWSGFAMIAIAAVTYTSATPFPGFAALLPVGGTLAVLAAGLPRAAWAPSRLLALRPVQFIGDVSYSIYLWHWPLLILLPLALGAPLTTIGKAGAIVACFGLAAITKRFVEDPGRRWRPLANARPRRTLAAMAVGMALVVATPVAAIALHRAALAGQDAAIDAAVAGRCTGAGALAPSRECPESTGASLLPDRASVYDDTQGAFACYDSSPDSDLPDCSLGSTRPDALRVALVGDSHGAMLVPALTDQAGDANWHVDVFVSRGCVWSQSDLANADNPCHARNAAMHERLTTGEPYDVVLLAARRSLDVPQGEPYVAFAQAGPQWDAVLARGTRIVAIADNPLVPPELVDCVIAAPDDAAARACAIPESAGYVWADGLADAARADPRIDLVDLREYFCRNGVCPMVIGDVIVYRDRDHMTATYSRSLAPFLVDEIRSLPAR
jgi:peptidoglycan/LPS O-acetylase OafA/YrhL